MSSFTRNRLDKFSIAPPQKKFNTIESICAIKGAVKLQERQVKKMDDLYLETKNANARAAKENILEEIKARELSYHDAIIVLNDVRNQLSNIAKIQ